jgi:crotonobetainyl-CoA:carnitine CoA-transferase CaiB-like acyl-CoA transferase
VTRKNLPLSGVRLLDFTRLLPGAYCSLLLTDLGAEVVKIEDLKGGDYMRWIPPLLGEYGVYFHAANRNKKSLAVDFYSEKGKDVVKRLIAQGDVLLEGFRPGVMEKLGLSYAQLSPSNPSLIYCAITGYGQEGPYSNKAGHDINYISIAGILGGTGPSDGDPVIPAVQIADISGSYVAALGITAALLERHRTGRGKFIDVSMTEAASSFMTTHLAPVRAGLFDKKSGWRGRGMLSGGLACYNVYRTKDGQYVSLGALEAKFWKEFLTLVGREDLIADQYIEEKQDALKAEMRRLFASKTRNEWLQMLQGKDVCCEPVYELDEVVNDPQLGARGAVARTDAAVPKYGEHTREILSQLGYSESQIRELVDHNVIIC